jgi:hypothetical protein
MVMALEDLFPGLRGAPYRVTSPRDRTYNCIAWAAADTRKWWWPDPEGEKFWPAGLDRVETLAVIEAAFASLGYAACAGEELEDGFEKVASFADAAGVPLHAARQLPNGLWTSKLGEIDDIEHPLRALEGATYGSVVRVLRRPLATGSPGGLQRTPDTPG